MKNFTVLYLASEYNLRQASGRHSFRDSGPPTKILKLHWISRALLFSCS